MNRKEKFAKALIEYCGTQKTQEIIDTCQIPNQQEFYIDVYKLQNLLNYDGDLLELLFEIGKGDDDLPHLLMEIVKNPEALGYNTLVMDYTGNIKFENNERFENETI